MALGQDLATFGFIPASGYTPPETGQHPITNFNNDFYEFLYDWINKVINIDGGENIIIIQSHQNTPIPEYPYITIEYNPNKEKIGRSGKTEPAGDTAEEPGLVKIYGMYQNRVEIRETGGDGDRLQALLDSIERTEIQDFFNQANVALYDSEPIQSIPRLDGKEWIREAVVEILFGISSVIEENTGWVETVNYEGTIGGKTI